MNINATVLVQAINFFVVYWMLRLLLFKPAIAIIEQEAAEKASVLSIINQQQKSLEIQEKERLRHWRVCQEYFIAHQPHLVQYFTIAGKTTIADDEYLAPLCEDELAEIITEVEKTIVEKIKHVH